MRRGILVVIMIATALAGTDVLYSWKGGAEYSCGPVPGTGLNKCGNSWNAITDGNLKSYSQNYDKGACLYICILKWKPTKGRPASRTPQKYERVSIVSGNDLKIQDFQYSTMQWVYHREKFIASNGAGNWVKGWETRSSLYARANLRFYEHAYSTLTYSYEVNPEIISINIAPELPRTGTDLNCYATIEDEDSINITAFSTWYHNGTQVVYNTSVSVGNETLVAVLSSNMTKKGENWHCKVRAFDGEGNSTVVNSSVVVQNTAPEINVDLGEYYAGSVIKPEVQATDEDVEDNLTFSYLWLINGNSTNNTSSILEVSFEESDNVTVIVTVSDGTANNSGSDSTIIKKRAPVILVAPSKPRVTKTKRKSYSTPKVVESVEEPERYEEELKILFTVRRLKDDRGMPHTVMQLVVEQMPLGLSILKRQRKTGVDLLPLVKSGIYALFAIILVTSLIWKLHSSIKGERI